MDSTPPSLEGLLPCANASRAPYPTIPLPIELRTKILQHSLLYYWPLFLREPAESGGRKTTPYLGNASLAKRFSALCLVSKQMREEARKVFFEQNKWCLNFHVRVTNAPTPLELREIRRGIRMGRAPAEIPAPVVETRVNDAATIAEYWGEETLLRMRNMEIVLHGGSFAHQTALSYVLVEVIEKLKGRNNLQKLTVKLDTYYGLSSKKCGNGSSAYRESVREGQRKGDGTRNIEEYGKYWQSWAASERILDSVLELRPLQQVKVTGCVTDEWAGWLETEMKEGAQQNRTDFEGFRSDYETIKHC